jgi:hypothetical protein
MSEGPGLVAALIASLMLFLVLPLGSALLLVRPSLNTKVATFLVTTAFLAMCLGAVMSGLALAAGGVTKATDAGCWNPPVGWHGCRAPDTLQALLVWGAIVVTLFVILSFAWRGLHVWRGRLRRADGEPDPS